jgi:peroxin-10
MLRDAMLDTARRVVSARRVVQYQNEIGVLAHLWYNALTTGLGTQTLGEEYCDLFQIDPRGAAPGATRRWALVFLDAFAQPAMRRVRVRARAAADRRDRGDVRPRAGDDVETIRADDDEESHSTSFLDAFSRRTAGKTLRRFVELADAALVAAFAPSPDPERPEPGDPTRGALVRGHLAIFFATGAFFSFAHRFANVRFAFVGTEGPEGRPRLGLLGYLLAAQLAYATVADGRAAWRAKVSNAESGGSENAEADADARRNTVDFAFETREADGSPSNAAESSVSPSSASRDHKKCALCLSPHDAPAATPCGHVFCWACVASWCAQKPECPLCRAPAAPQSLVRVAGW